MARITSQYGDVYFLATDASVCRSSLERPMVNGLFLGIRDATPLMQAYQITSPLGLNNTSPYLRIDVLSQLNKSSHGLHAFQRVSGERAYILQTAAANNTQEGQ